LEHSIEVDAVVTGYNNISNGQTNQWPSRLSKDVQLTSSAAAAAVVTWSLSSSSTQYDHLMSDVTA